MRSGDKGNSCNVGVIARHPAFLPYIRSALSEEKVGHHFRHMIQVRFYVFILEFLKKEKSVTFFVH